MKIIQITNHQLAAIIRGKFADNKSPEYVVVIDKLLHSTNGVLYYLLVIRKKVDGKMFEGRYNFSRKGFLPVISDFDEIDEERLNKIVIENGKDREHY